MIRNTVYALGETTGGLLCAYVYGDTSFIVTFGIAGDDVEEYYGAEHVVITFDDMEHTLLSA